MSGYEKNALITGILVTALIVAHPAEATDKEKQMPLGVVNGLVKDNQRVEVTRTLPSPELYRETDVANLPTELRIRNASARMGDNGTVWLTISEPLASGEKMSVTARIAIWVDGTKVPTGYREEGMDVVLPVPPAQKEVVLRSDTPVTLAVPAGWRGELRQEMVIEGWMQ